MRPNLSNRAPATAQVERIPWTLTSWCALLAFMVAAVELVHLGACLYLIGPHAGVLTIVGGLAVVAPARSLLARKPALTSLFACRRCGGL